jgi:predicted Zn-dependent peptidase
VKADTEQSERERNVVLQEYNQYLGRNTYARFRVALSRALMPGESLGQSVIGSPESVKSFTYDAARDFHKDWYAKTNAVIVLYGPIDPDAIRPLVDKHLDPLPSRSVPAHAWALVRKYEPSTQVLKETDKTAKQVRVFLEKIVHYDEPTSLADRRVLNSARNIVGAFVTSNLVGSPLDVLAEQGNLVAQGNMSVNKLRAGTLRLSFWAVPAVGVAPETVIDAVQAYVRKLPFGAITGQTVERLKLRDANARDLLRQQPDKYAEALVNWFAGHDNHDHWRERDTAYARVSVETVRTILAALAQPGREVVGVMLPADPLRSNEPMVQQP